MFISEKYSRILSKVLKEIKPSEEELKRQNEIAMRIVNELDRLTPKDVQIELVGSMAKGTNLKGDMDFDVFLLFPKDYSLKEMLSLAMKCSKKFCKGRKYEIAYAQHPYVRTWIEGIEVDIVPSYKIEDSSQIETAVDRSPLHTKFVNSNITDSQRDDVRLLKKFLKTQKIYGAEGKIRGFSGYLCELLILKYGSFLSVLDAFANMKSMPVLSLGSQSINEEDLKKKFSDAAMIFIDPVDPERNVAASVSKTSLSIFSYAASIFLSKPSISAFLPPQEKIDRKWIDKQLRLRDSLFLGIEFDRPKGIVEDILWPQMYKFSNKIKSRVEENNFEVFDIDHYANGKCLLLCEFSVYSLPKIKKIYGPPLSQKESVYKFIREHNVTEPIWFEEERILAVGERKYTDVRQIIEYIIKRPEENGVPPDIRKVIKSAKIISIDKIKKDYTQFLFEYLKKRNVP
ncbi:MAG: CCA tRNA nucleotidyltransferase [Candidatus Micrarchaeota archaeon]|nr:CCA tRNA nucleotidyltransferase [Candidatus Micrarchaeota archaeon]